MQSQSQDLTFITK